MAQEKPHFHVTVFLCPLIFGPPVQMVTSLKHMNYSNDVFYSLWNGTYQDVPPTTFPAYVRLLLLTYAVWVLKGCWLN